MRIRAPASPQAGLERSGGALILAPAAHAGHHPRIALGLDPLSAGQSAAAIASAHRCPDTSPARARIRSHVRASNFGKQSRLYPFPIGCRLSTSKGTREHIRVLASLRIHTRRDLALVLARMDSLTRALALPRTDRACGWFCICRSWEIESVLAGALRHRGPSNPRSLDRAAVPLAPTALQASNTPVHDERGGLYDHDRHSVRPPPMARHPTRRGSRRNDSAGGQERQRDDHSPAGIRQRCRPSNLPRNHSTLARGRNHLTVCLAWTGSHRHPRLARPPISGHLTSANRMSRIAFARAVSAALWPQRRARNARPPPNVRTSYRSQPADHRFARR